MRYYATQRPLVPGACPSEAREVHNFDFRTFVPNIGREAWGYLETDEPLSAEEVSQFELVSGEERLWHCLFVKEEDGMLSITKKGTKASVAKPEEREKITKRGFVKELWFASEEEANDFVAFIS